jgi:hypothetical protein
MQELIRQSLVLPHCGDDDAYSHDGDGVIAI